MQQASHQILKKATTTEIKQLSEKFAPARNPITTQRAFTRSNALKSI
jgi:hypothetical protein